MEGFLSQGKGVLIQRSRKGRNGRRKRSENIRREAERKEVKNTWECEGPSCQSKNPERCVDQVSMGVKQVTLLGGKM